MLKARPPREVTGRKPLICIYGDAKVGKTSMVLQFPKTYVFDPENGASQLHYLEALAANGGAYLGSDDGADNFDVVIRGVGLIPGDWDNQLENLVE